MYSHIDTALIYEDEQILALNKPAGMLVHADGTDAEGETVAGWVRAHYPQTEGVGEPLTLQSGEAIARPGIVHRLDKDTSGVLLVAKTAEAHAHLKQQFQDRTVEKTYNAFVYGRMNESSGTIDKPIGRSAKDFRRRSARQDARGTLREALTEFSVVQRNKNATFVEARPKTGRTHQLRVHFAAIDHPVVCDRLYAPKRSCILGFNRLALHARRISFIASDGTRLTLEAPLPEDFEAALAQVAGAEAA